MQYRRERIITGLILSSIPTAAGGWLRFNAEPLSATPRRIGITYPLDKVNAYSQLGLALFIFGLVLAAIAFHHWLSPQSMSPDQS